MSIRERRTAVASLGGALVAVALLLPIPAGAAGGLDRGVFLLRYDGVAGEIPEKQHPSAALVDLADLPELIPGFEAVDPAERTRTRAARRQHLQRRSGR